MAHPAPLPENEKDRLLSLRGLMVLDSDSESLFDDITRLAKRICGTSVALISLVDEKRQWFKSNIGLEGVTETSRELAFCAHAILEHKVMEVPDATKDPRFNTNPLVTGDPRIRFYAGAPIVLPNDYVIGTLCVFDQSPLALNSEQKSILEDLAKSISSMLLFRQSTIHRVKNEASKLSAIVESSQDAIITKSLDGLVTSWNHGAELIFGYSYEEVIGKNTAFLIPQDKLDEDESLIGSLLNNNIIEHYETERINKQGELIHVSVSLSTLRDAFGNVIGISKIFRDITSNKLLQMELAQENERLKESEIMLAKAIEKQGFIEGKLNHNLDLFNKLSLRVPGVIYQFRLFPDGHSCFPYASEGTKHIYEINPEEIREDASPVFALLHPEDYDGIIASINESARNLSIWKYDYRVVLPKQGVCWRSGEAQPEKLDDGSVLWHGLIRDITDRKKIEQSLSLSQFSIDNTQDAIFRINWESDILYVNDAACQHLGYSEDELLNMTIPDIDPDYKQKDWHSHREELVKSGSIQFETRHKRKDGTIIPVEIVTSAMNYNGEFYFFASVRNISERKHAEENLNKLKSRFQFLLNSSPAVIYSCEAFGDFGATFISENITSQLGYTPNEFSDNSSFWLNHIHPDDKPNVVNNLKHLLDAGIHKHQYRLQHKDGRYLWMQDEALLIYDDHGNPKEIVGCWVDINQQKLAEERVFRLSNLYKALSEVNQAIVHMKEQAELFPLICKCAVDFGGMSMAFIGQLNEQGDRFIPVESYGSNLNYLDDIFISPNADVPEGSGPVGIAFRENHPVIVENYSSAILTSPWHERAAKNNWNSAAAFPIQKGGKPFAVLSVYHSYATAFDTEAVALLEEMSSDISFALDNFDREINRIASEQSLRLAASVFDASSEGIMITDTDNCIVAVNSAFKSITGLSDDEVLGKTPNVLESRDHDATFNEAFWHEVNSTSQWQGEVWNKRKNGDVYPSLLTIDTIYNTEGKPHNRVAMFMDISQRKEADHMIWRQANFDFLTGLPNRQMFYDRLDQGIKKAQRDGRSIALLFIDLDRFKEVNDTLGHDTGDAMLKEAAHRLSSCVRETDTVARLGGDEFTVILGEIHDPSSIELITQNILSKISEPFHLNNEIAYVSASIGITIYPDDTTSLATLVKNADQAMYAAKSQGRNCCSYFTHAMQLAVQERVKIANDLRSALSKKQFWIAYQPILELATGIIYKAEALIRWNHPEKGLISPDKFIPIAEDTGLIVEIGEWVFQEAIKQVKVWRECLHPEFQISVNKSPVQFQRGDKSRQSWPDCLKQLGLPGESISVEITEGLLLDANKHVTERFGEFRNAGIQFSIDDFGTGYSALSYLIKFDIDYLKIDRSFIKNLNADTEDFTLCKAIIEMAHKLNLKVIAEGVETQDQCNLLKQIGCDYGQGFLWSKPVISSEFEALFIKK